MYFQKAKVLIIDDEKAILKMLSRRFDLIGLVADVAESAEGGINKISSNQYDLIFTDIKMPGMSGHDVYTYVRTNEKRSIPIIAMSGTPWLTEQSNFDAVIAKPFSIEELLDVVGRFVQTIQP